MDSPDDQRLFEDLVRRYRAGEFAVPPQQEPFQPLQPGDIQPLPKPGTAEYTRASGAGEAAMRQGAVAALVVAGGAGTRFGGAVKALVPVLDGKTFLDFKLADVARASARAGRPLSVALMTSHLTDAGIRAAVAARPPPVPVHLFQQRSLPRLRPDGSVFRGPDGAPSLAPAGHGDVFRALVASGVARHAACQWCTAPLLLQRGQPRRHPGRGRPRHAPVVRSGDDGGGDGAPFPRGSARPRRGAGAPPRAATAGGKSGCRRTRHHLHQQHHLRPGKLAHRGGAAALAGGAQGRGRRGLSSSSSRSPPRRPACAAPTDSHCCQRASFSFPAESRPPRASSR